MNVISAHTRRDSDASPLDEPPSLTLAGLPEHELSETRQAWLKTLRQAQDLLTIPFPLDQRSLQLTPRLASEVLRCTDTRVRAPLSAQPHDLLVRVATPLLEALEAIQNMPRSVLRRRSERTPIHKVREVNDASLRALARQPGQTPRQKLMMARSIPAPRRYASMDTLENRVVKRLIVDIRRALEARRRAALEVRSSHDEGSLASFDQLLGPLLRCCALLLQPSSPFATLPDAIAPRPNNALISDRHYGLSWRVFRSLRAERDRQRRAWRQRDEILRSAVLRAITARAARSTSMWIPEHVITPSEWGVTPAERDASNGQETPHRKRVELLKLNTEHPALLTFELDQHDDVYCQHRPFEAVTEAAAGLMPGTRHVLEIGLGEANEARRGVTLHLMPCTGEEPIALWQEPADREGFSSTADLFVQEVLNITPEPVEAGPSPSPAHITQLGASLEGAHIMLSTASETEVQTQRMLLLAASLRGTEQIATGLSAARVIAESDAAEGEFMRVDAMHALSPSRGTQDGGLSERLARAAWNGALTPTMFRQTELALAIPDDLDELDATSLRRVLPTARDTWLIWRSVAVVLSWRDSDSPRLREGDVVVVLDLSEDPPTATMLTTRVDENTDETADALYWERSAPFAPLPSSEETHLASRRAFTLALAQRLTAAIEPAALREASTRRLIEEGHLDDLTPRIISLPHLAPDTPRDDAWRIVRVSLRSEHINETELEAARARSAWAEEFCRIHASDLITHTATTLRVLVVGLPGSAMQRSLTSRIEDHFGDGATAIIPGDDALSRGCLCFLERHAAGLPTYRDLLPALYLRVGDTLQIPLLDPEELRRGVRPAQRLNHTPPERFEIPAGRDTLELPLIVGDASSKRQGLIIATVTDDALPLDKPVAVALTSSYQHARDAFIVSIRPIRPRDAPFGRIELQWSRRDDASALTAVTTRNEPPQFVSTARWDDPTRTARLDDLANRRAELESLLAVLEDGQRAHHRLHHDLKGLRGDVIALIKLCKALGELFTEIIPPGLTATPPRPDLEHIRLAMCVLERVSGVDDVSSGSKRGRKQGHRKGSKKHRHGAGKARKNLPKLRKKLSASKHQKLLSLLDSARDEATWSLARMRHHAPTTLATMLFEELTGTSPSEHFEALGRALQPSLDAHQEALEQFISRSADVLAATAEPAPELRHRLWAIATLLWSRKENPASLTRPQVEAIRDAISSIFSHLAEDSIWYVAGIAVELFHEAGIIALGLLRLRQKPLDELVRAGDTWCEQLAASAARAGKRLPRRTARVRVEDGDGFDTVLVDNLRGRRVAQLSLIEE